MQVKQEISKRFEQNLARVESLLQLYPGDGAGRRDVATTDLLRAAVVFLHATMEDLLRSLLEWRLPAAPPSAFADVALVGCKPRSRFTLEDLVRHRGATVDDVIRESVAEHLLDSNFNHPGEVRDALEMAGLKGTLLGPHRNELGAMMSRRHWIVHRADRNQVVGVGQHPTRSLAGQTVRAWLETVRAFGTAVLDET